MGADYTPSYCATFGVLACLIGYRLTLFSPLPLLASDG
jgi:hypothetical protein